MRLNNKILLLILLLALSLRVIGFDWGLPNSQHKWPYHPDEALGLICLANMNPASLDFSPHNFVWGSFYIYELGLWLKSLDIFGFINLSQDINYYKDNINELTKVYLGGRILTLLWGLIGIFYLFLLAKKFYGQKEGLLSVLFVSIVPFAVIHAHYMTPHIQFATLNIVSLYFLGLIIKNNRLRDYLFFSISAAVSFTTYWWPALALLPVFILAVHFNDPQKTVFEKFFGKKMILSVIFYFLIIFITAPYVFLNYKQFISFWQNQNILYFKDANKSLIRPFYDIFPYALGWGLTFLVIIGAVWAGIKKTKVDKILLTWVILYFLGVVLAGGGTLARRFFPLLLIGIVLAARVSVELIGKFNLKFKLKFWATVLFMLVMLESLSVTLGLLNIIAFQKDTRTKALKWIDKNIEKGKVIGIESWFYIPHINVNEYKIKKMVQVKKKKDKFPDYVVVSNFDSLTKDFFKNNSYSLVATFRNFPSIFGLKFDDSRAPEDMKITHPDIYIFKYERL
jgi:hypothetical protein